MNNSSAFDDNISPHSSQDFNPSTPSVGDSPQHNYQGQTQTPFDDKDESESMFTPNTPQTPYDKDTQESMFTPHHSDAAATNPYDPSDMSSNDEAAMYSVESGHSDYENGSYGGVPNSQDSAHLSSDVASESATELINQQQNNDPYYYVKNGAYLKYNDKGCQVKQISGDTVKLQMLDGGDQISVTKDALQHVAPPENSRVQVVLGRLMNERGELIGIDGDDAIVKMDVTNEIQILAHNSLVQVESVM